MVRTLSETKPLRRRLLFWLAVGAACLLLAGILRLLCDTAAGDGVRAFAARLSGLLSRLFSFSRRPVGEWLLILVVPGVPLGLIVAAVRGGWRGFLLWLSRSLALCGAICLLFMAAFGVQYTGSDLADALDLPTGGYTTRQMTRTLEVLAREINAVAPAVPRDETGNCDYGAFDAQAAAVMAAYDRLDDRIPALAAVSPVAPKES
ncbi:MAG: DUF3810 family protein, partial [Clostridia bacterium]|nr:DUF3810 family protein [Clostridia bacterium]